MVGDFPGGYRARPVSLSGTNCGFCSGHCRRFLGARSDDTPLREVRVRTARNQGPLRADFTALTLFDPGDVC